MRTARLSSAVLILLAASSFCLVSLGEVTKQKPVSPPTAVNRTPERLISVDFGLKGKPLPDALRQIATLGNLTLIIDENVPQRRIIAGSLSHITATRALGIICDNARLLLRQVGDTYVVKPQPNAVNLPPKPATPPTPASPCDLYGVYAKLPATLVALNAHDLPLTDVVQQLVTQLKDPRYTVEFHPEVPRDLQVIEARVQGQPFNQVLKFLLEQAGLTAGLDQPAQPGTPSVIHIRISAGPWIRVGLPGYAGLPIIFNQDTLSSYNKNRRLGERLTEARVAEWNRQLVTGGYARPDWPTCGKCRVLLNPAWRFCPFCGQAAPELAKTAKVSPALKP